MMPRRLSQWLLAALLVIAQAALLIHQSDVDAHAHGEHCPVCLLVHGLDNAVPSQFVLRVDKLDPPVFIIAGARVSAPQTASYYRTRAPPLYAPHS